MFRLSNPSSALTQEADNDNGGTNSTCRQQALRQKLAHHHPNVKLPPRLEEKTHEEQIQRCCDRFKSFPATVDTLIRTLQTILSNQNSSGVLPHKYRTIDQTNPSYQQRLAAVPGAEKLLLALGFVSTGNAKHSKLFLPSVNAELFQMALERLHLTKQTPEYQQADQERRFAKEVSVFLAEAPSPVEGKARQHFLSQVPREPAPDTTSAVIIIHLGDAANGTTVTRRFEGDDTLQDVLHWLGGTVGTTFLDKLTKNQWSLVDVNASRLNGQTPIDCSDSSARLMTLQHLGFWPSGRLQLRPASDTNASSREVSRGLASAHA